MKALYWCLGFNAAVALALIVMVVIDKSEIWFYLTVGCLSLMLILGMILAFKAYMKYLE